MSGGRIGGRSRRALAAGVLASALLGGAAAASAEEPAARRPDEASHLRTDERVAEAITVATGVPISPLLGVSALGAYRWWRAPPPARAHLPWYTRPWFWSSGLGLALLFALNTTIGGLVPGLKKPMDWVEQFENQASALLASPAVLYEVYRIVGSPPELAASPLVAAGGGAAALASLPPLVAVLARFGTAALVLAAFFVVFLAFHALQVLIALSPSTLLDLALRALRFAALMLSGMAASVDPWVGAAFGLLLLGAAALVAGWAFRLAVFGSIFAWDLLRARPASAAAPDAPLAAFAARGLSGAPVRAYGRVESLTGGGLRFVWRPWLCLPRRAVGLPGDLAIRRGALAPSLFRIGGVREPTLLRFSARYRGREEEIRRRVGAAEVRDGRLVRGLRAAVRWLWATVRGGEGAEELAR